MEKIKIKYLSDKIERLRYIDGKSDWIDLRAAERVELKKGEFQLIPLGVAMQLPQGFEAHIVPRSSTFRKWGILQANSMGVIDESYCGDDDVWGFPALAMRDTTIARGDRICQFRVMRKMDKPELVTVERLDNASRGGFGSTGLFQFCLYIRSFENGKRISCLHALSLFHPELQDTSRYFARYAIFCYFGLPLYDFRPFAQHEETYEGNDGDYSRQSEECQQHVTVL